MSPVSPGRRMRDFSKSSSRDCLIGDPRQIDAQIDQSVGTRPAFRSPLAFRSTGFESSRWAEEVQEAVLDLTALF